MLHVGKFENLLPLFHVHYRIKARRLLNMYRLYFFTELTSNLLLSAVNHIQINEGLYTINW